MALQRTPQTPDVAPPSPEDFLHAAEQGDIPVLESFLQAYPESEFIPFAFIQLAQGGYDQGLALLLRYKADVNQTDASNMTALDWVCDNGHYNAARLLLEKGAAIGNALGYAANREIAQLLLDFKADIERRDDLGRTPLIRYATDNRVDCMELALKQHADTEAVDNSGHTARSAAPPNSAAAATLDRHFENLRKAEDLAAREGRLRLAATVFQRGLSRDIPPPLRIVVSSHRPKEP